MKVERRKKIEKNDPKEESNTTWNIKTGKEGQRGIMLEQSRRKGKGEGEERVGQTYKNWLERR